MDPIYPNTGKRENLQSFRGTAIQDRPAAAGVLDQAKDKATDLIDKAKDKASDAMDTVKETYSHLGGRLQEGGEYLRERAVEGFEEVTDLIRRNPVPALLISFCAGFCLYRLLKD